MAAESAYVATSVLGAYYCPEPLSEAAESALMRVKEPCISPLTEVEFASLIARKRRLRELSEREAADVLRMFGRHAADGHYRRLALGADHFLRARDLLVAMKSALTTLDALHLSIALSAGLPLLTSDRAFASAARRHDASATLVK
jgi:predicted nucleic acid-binding protein